VLVTFIAEEKKKTPAHIFSLPVKHTGYPSGD
jgi:hypothetical protein